MITGGRSRRRNGRARPVRSGVFLVAAMALVAAPLEGTAPQQGEFPVVRGAQVGPPVIPSVFRGDLRNLPRAREWAPGDPIREVPRRHYLQELPSIPAPAPRRDPHLDTQARAPELSAPRLFDRPELNFEGQGFSGVNPPDTVGDVGREYYIQMINHLDGTSFVVYDKSDGSVAAGPMILDTLGTGNCGNGLGDPIVLYDHLAERWFLSEFSRVADALCVYVSMTSDPISGGWFGYEFTTPNFPDYPKYAVWPDAYYVSTNEIGDSPVYALERDQMLAGNAASSQRFTAPDMDGFGFQALTPADLDGPSPPPPGSPAYFARHRDDEAHDSPGTSDDFVEVWAFSVDWATPSNSTFSQVASVPVAEFDSDLCGLFAFECVPQPGSSVTLDPLREVVMWRLVYRNFGTHETLVGNFVTDLDGTDHHGVRWFELRQDGASWSLHQEGTFGPDSEHRWMGAIAMNRTGDIVLGYNVSSSTTHPGIRYTGRLEGDPAGTMPRGEHVLVAGSAANDSNRYGDYSAMSVDPVDDCTFWFTGEYNPSNLWSTRIGRLALNDDCRPLRFFIGEELEGDVRTSTDVETDRADDETALRSASRR